MQWFRGGLVFKAHRLLGWWQVEHYPHRYLNAEKVLLPPVNRDFKFDAKVRVCVCVCV